MTLARSPSSPSSAINSRVEAIYSPSFKRTELLDRLAALTLEAEYLGHKITLNNGGNVRGFRRW